MQIGDGRPGHSYPIDQFSKAGPPPPTVRLSTHDSPTVVEPYALLHVTRTAYGRMNKNELRAVLCWPMRRGGCLDCGPQGPVS